MKTDMTQGKPVKVLLGFTIPVFIGNVFQQFYNMVDAVVVGKFVGTKALAAVGSTGTIIFLIIGFLLGLTAGFTVLTAQKYGAGKMDEMRQTVGNTDPDRCDFRSYDSHQHDRHACTSEIHAYTG